jgi:hypothetical protein
LYEKLAPTQNTCHTRTHHTIQKKVLTHTQKPAKSAALKKKSTKNYCGHSTMHHHAIVLWMQRLADGTRLSGGESFAENKPVNLPSIGH